MSRAAFMALAVLGSSLASPVMAQQTGTAMTVETGGSAKGCVEWSHQTLARPSTSSPERQLVYFRLVNKCGREVSVLIASQTADYAQRVGDNGGIVLEPGQSYGDTKTIRNYIFFTPRKDRFLNFWVFQSDRRFNASITPDMNRCVPGFQPARNSKRHYPACPPAFRYK